MLAGTESSVLVARSDKARVPTDPGYIGAKRYRRARTDCD